MHPGPLLPSVSGSLIPQGRCRTSTVVVLIAMMLASPFAAAEPNEPSAGDYLVIDHQEALETGEGVRLMLRNASEHTITAWSILYEVGTSSGVVKRASTAQDAYHVLPFKEVDDDLPLDPGQTAIVEIQTPGVNLAPDRFTEGNYAVFSGRVSAVFFDNGEFLGDERDLIERFINRRVAEVTSMILVRERLIALKSTHGESDQLLSAIRELASEAKPFERTQVPQRVPTPEERIAHREQSGLNFALQYAQNILTLSDRIGTQSAYAFVLDRLNTSINNGLRNLPRTEREALQ